MAVAVHRNAEGVRIGIFCFAPEKRKEKQWNDGRGSPLVICKRTLVDQRPPPTERLKDASHRSAF